MTAYRVDSVEISSAASGTDHRQKHCCKEMLGLLLYVQLLHFLWTYYVHVQSTLCSVLS